MFMTKNILPKIRISLLLAFFLAGSANLYSQQTDRLITVRKLAVKPDRIEEFRALQTEMSEAWDKAGRGRRWIWKRMDGDLHTFHIISESDSFAERGSGEPIMDQAHRDLWLNAMNETIRSRELITTRRVLSIPLKGKPKYVVVTQRTILPGKTSEYFDFIESRLPTFEKSGSNGRVWDRVLYGGSNHTISTGRFIDSWAELDGPHIDLPAEERQRIFEGVTDFFAGDYDRYVLRFEEEMSTGSF
ncbi:MAG: hypothetical protein CMD99_02140 [Gammaproteobacteria bacterium]|nr:hypothetical protein [Gammaproteobacteria bacterium]